MKVSRKFLQFLVPLVAVVLSNSSFAGPLAEGAVFQQTLPLYTASLANSPVVTGPNKLEHYGNLEGLAASARLIFKTNEYRMVADTQAFTWKSSVVTSVNGWREKGALYVWRGNKGEPSSPLTIPLAHVLEPGKKSFPFGGFDEFWLDYTPLPGATLCTPQVEFKGKMRPQGDSRALQKWLAQVSNTSLFKTLVTIDVTRAKWRKRDKSYLAQRVFGLAPDEDWRYTQDQQSAVLQRRLHVRLDNIESLDIALSPNIKVERINLMISRKDDYRAGEIVEFAGVQQNRSLSEGRQGIRLNLRQALEEHFAKERAENAKEPNKHHFYLQEVFIFIHGKAYTIAAMKPVHSLVFLGKGVGEKIQKNQPILQEPIFLASDVVGVNAFRQRMVVDLRRLAGNGNASLKNTVLSLYSPLGAASCAIRIEGIQAVSTYNGNMPAFAQRLEDWSRRWGGMFSVMSPKYGQIEQPGIVAYLPLSVLANPEVEYVDSRVEETGASTPNKWSQAFPKTDQVENLQPIAQLSLSEAKQNGTLGTKEYISNRLSAIRQPLSQYRILGVGQKEVMPDRGHLVSSSGATLGSKDAMPRASVEGDLLVLSGKSQALEISWPLTVHVDGRTWLYFGVGEGVEQIGSITLTLGLADGNIVQRHVVANQPVQLLLEDAVVQHLTLRILPAVTPYRFKLHELAVFSPTVANYAQAFTVPLPTPYNATPMPILPVVGDGILEIQPGHIAGLAGDTPVRFTTRFDPLLDWVRGVRLNYRLPPSHIDSEGCPLTLQFNWANGKTERQLCIDRANDSIFIPLANWLDVAEKPRNLGALHSIDWVLSIPGSGARGVTESFELNFMVEGLSMLSAADHLHLSPLFFAGREPVFADTAQFKKSVGERYFRKVWLPLEGKALARILAAEGRILPEENWLFTLEQVVAEPREPMSWGWRLADEPTASTMLSHWPVWLSWASIVLLAWATWRRMGWQPARVWMLGKYVVNILAKILRWAFAMLGCWLWRRLHFLNVLVGSLALGPGLWLAGRYGLNFAGTMVLAASGLIMCGAYCHWRERAGQNWAEHAVARRMRLAALVVSLGCAIWSVGYSNLSGNTLWGVLPLMGATYALLPALYRLVQRLVEGNRWVVWLALATVFQGIGLMFMMGDGENYFFIFGWMAVVMAWRDWAECVRGRVQARWPSMAEKVYGSAGPVYFAGALVGLVLTAALLILHLELIAEQVAVVVYCFLVVGTVLEIRAFHQGARERNKRAAEEIAG